MKNPVQVAISGAAGQLAYALLFRLANGDVFGADQPVELRLLEVSAAMGTLEGVALELEDCALPLLSGLHLSDQPEQTFEGANWCLLVGSKPRGAGETRADLLSDNGSIFVSHGRALGRAAKDVQILVVGNPANTNCLIALSNAVDVPKERFQAMTRLDHNRAVTQLANKAGVAVEEVSGMTIWGNHSATQFPDFYHARIRGKPAIEVIDELEWLKNDFIQSVQQRGAEIIKARGLSSAASAANAVIDHVRSMISATAEGEWFSSAVYSSGQYDCPEGLVSSFPIAADGKGAWKIIEGLEHPQFARDKIVLSFRELQSERDLVQELIPV